MKKIFLIIIIFLPFTVNADVYTWKDPQGGTHISDQPQPGATRMELPATAIYYPNTQPAVAVTDATSNEPILSVYSSFNIVQPLNQQIFVNNENGNLVVTVAVDPALQGSDSVRLIIDGKVSSPQKNMTFSINNIDRGTHVLQAQIIDEHGDVLCTSTSITIYMQRPRIKF